MDLSHGPLNTDSRGLCLSPPPATQCLALSSEDRPLHVQPISSTRMQTVLRYELYGTRRILRATIGGLMLRISATNVLTLPGKTYQSPSPHQMTHVHWRTWTVLRPTPHGITDHTFLYFAFRVKTGVHWPGLVVTRWSQSTQLVKFYVGPS